MNYRIVFPAVFLVCLFAAAFNFAGAQDSSPQAEEAKQPAGEKAGDDVLAGHSAHGEAFNEGPRQQAYLMEGTGAVKFPVTTDKPLAQKFIEQGVGQLHGFWYFEAERSFRQAAAIDPDCPISYWGMAMANVNNKKRSEGFIAEAVKRKDQASRREQMYIEALDDYIKAPRDKKKERAEKYTKALERLLHEYPDDVEARAFLALQLWQNRSNELPITSYLAVDALIQQVFQAEPMHPAHHYRIHLWDYEKAETAVSSAARCGQSAPAIAHMWHMPGHIFSRLKRYDDAAWQQEASARTDHAHMMRDRVMPDQIHNFAHNNEWLIRNLVHVGRVGDAVDLAKNMIELPRHPKHNTLARRGSANYGRMRLFEVLSTYELWDHSIALCDTPYLEPTTIEKEQVKRLRHLGAAFYRGGNAEQGDAQLAEIERRLDESNEKREKAAAEAEAKAKKDARDQKAIDEATAQAEEKARADGADDEKIAEARSVAEAKIVAEGEKKNKKKIDKAIADAKKRFSTRIRDLERARDELRGHQAVAKEDYAAALPLLKKASGVDAMYRALVQFQAGQQDEALKAAQKHVDSNKNEVQPLAAQIDLLWRAEKRDEAKAAFDKLREISGSIDAEASPMFRRLAPIAKELGFGDDWRLVKTPRDDIGDRPDLDTLGPFRWRPSPAPEWTLRDAKGAQRSLADFRGKPLVLIFYLGYGCLHCAEQLQAFAPMIDEFRAAGIDMAAISTDDLEGLQISLKNYDKGDLPIPLLANAEMNVFKEYRAFDDFEQQPLHGTFVIDGEGLVRWQDISYEPFMDPKFVLKEAQRLLAQSAAQPPAAGDAVAANSAATGAE